MKKTMCFLAASTVLISGLCQAAGVMNETVLKEKAAFSLGVTKDKVTIEESDRTPEENNYTSTLAIRANCSSATLPTSRTK